MQAVLGNGCLKHYIQQGAHNYFRELVAWSQSENAD